MKLVRHRRPRKHFAGASALLGLVLGASGLLSACLVTEKVEHEELNYAPYVRVEAPNIVSQVPAFPNCPGVSPPPIVNGEELPFKGPWMRFAVQVTDPNVDDVLMGRVIVNGVGPNPVSATIPTTGLPEREPIEFCLDAAFLSRACNHVEFLVSSRFSDGVGFPYAPVQEGDVGRVAWIVRGLSRDAPTSSEDDCLSLFDGGVP